MRPTDGLAGGRDLGFAERFSVRLFAAGTIWRPLAYDGACNDQRGPIRTPRLRDRDVDRRDVMAVDRSDHVPVIGAEARGAVVCEPMPHFAVDRDAVVVVDRNDLRELPRP